VLPTRAQVHDVIERAVISLYERDKHRLDVGVGERSLVFRIGAHLEPLVTAWPGDWAVDTEYNRRSRNEHEEATYKYLLDVLGEPRRPAYPDLIVHRPGIDGQDDGNLLVLEAKRSPNGTERAEDHAKLVAWTRELQYAYAVRLELHPDEPRLAWVSAEDDERTVSPAQPLPGGHP
jgi:hypothetical protein